MCRETVHETEDYCVDLEYASGEVFIHCDVWAFNKSIYEELCELWLDMEEALRNEGFTRVLAVPKKKGLVTMMGWEPLTSVNLSGREWEVFQWDLLHP